MIPLSEKDNTGRKTYLEKEELRLQKLSFGYVRGRMFIRHHSG
jgi:hypothetical protein